MVNRGDDKITYHGRLKKKKKKDKICYLNTCMSKTEKEKERTVYVITIHKQAKVEKIVMIIFRCIN